MAAKEYLRLRKNIARLTDGQVSVCDVDWDSGRLDKFRVVVSPNSGLYKGGKFVFRIELQEPYPSQSPPIVVCETDIYHPNIDPSMYSSDTTGGCTDYWEDDMSDGESNVCLNILEEGTWNKSFGLEALVLGLLFLMHNPNFSDPLNSEFSGFDDEEQCREDIMTFMRGEEVNGYSYKSGLEDDEKLNDLDALSSSLSSKTSAETLEECPTSTVHNLHRTHRVDSASVINDLENDSSNDTCNTADMINDAAVVDNANDDKSDAYGCVLSKVDTGITEEDTQSSAGRGGTKQNIQNNLHEKEDTGDEKLVNETSDAIDILSTSDSCIRDNVSHSEEEDKDVCSHGTISSFKKSTSEQLQSKYGSQNQTTERQTDDSETVADNVNTRMIAFDGGFILIGGNESEMKEIETVKAGTVGVADTDIEDIKPVLIYSDTSAYKCETHKRGRFARLRHRLTRFMASIKQCFGSKCDY